MGNNNSQQNNPPQVEEKKIQNTDPRSKNCVFHPEIYQGKWYEIARYRNSYEVECARSEKRLKWDSKDKKMYIKNTCIREDESKYSIRGVGTPNDNHACQLTVKFEGVPVKGQYWIIWTDYDKWSLVGNENRTAFWMLSRTPYISRDDYRLLKSYAVASGYKGDLIIPRNAIVGYKIENQTFQAKFMKEEKNSDNEGVTNEERCSGSDKTCFESDF